jgi:predicted TIM-barrel fold metal-dependent hydrolase
MQIIDSHVHFWNPHQLRYLWLDDVTALNRPYLPTDYQLAVGDIEVSGIVFVQADAIPQEALDEVRWVQSLDSTAKSIVAFAPLEQGDAARPLLERLAVEPRVRGVRRLLQSEVVDFATQPDFVRSVQSLGDYQLSFDICIFHHQLPAVIALVRQCPQITFVLDHGGKPGIKAGLIDPWREHIQALASFENVSCKLSGLVTEAEPETWTADDLRPYISHLLDAFGTERLMFGSDWPVVNLAGGYGRWFSALKLILDELSDDERRSIYASNAARVYRIDLDDL